MNSRKETEACKGMAAFLLRAFAARRAQHAPATNVKAPAAVEVGEAMLAAGMQPSCHPAERKLAAPSFDDALGQCGDYRECDSADGSFYDKREQLRERAIDLASKQAGKLVAPRTDALALLRAEPHNSFTLRDPSGRARGWVMYPQVSFLNHSCLPCAATVGRGRALEVETLRDVSCGEELTVCYLRLGGTDDDGLGTSVWGFDCGCARCGGVATDDELRAFDAAFRCACGTITTPRMLALGGGQCHCHEQSRAPPPEASAIATPLYIGE